MEKIIERIKKGELCRCNDESYRGGLWDYAFDNYGEQNGELVYGDLWELVDIMKINKCKDCK